MDNALETTSPEQLLFVFAFLISGACGVAWLLRSNLPINYRSVASAILNSGLLGLIVSLLWYRSYHEAPYFLLGICGLAGIGGVATVEICSNFFTRILGKYLGTKFGVQLLSDKEEEPDGGDEAE